MTIIFIPPSLRNFDFLMFKLRHPFHKKKEGISNLISDKDRISYMFRKINILKSKRKTLASHRIGKYYQNSSNRRRIGAKLFSETTLGKSGPCGPTEKPSI